MPIVTPDWLEADAVVPQCLDNQFVSDSVLETMLARKGDNALYEDREIKKDRTLDTKAEFIRSLLYSSQVVVNRAYFKNCHYLLDQATEHGATLAGLINEHAVVPYLHKSKSFDEKEKFTTVAGNTLKRLSEQIDPQKAAFLRFAEEDAENDGQIEELSANFEHFCLGWISDAHKSYVPAMAHQLFTNAALTDRSPDGLPADVLHRFRIYLQALGAYAADRGPRLAKDKEQFGRQHVYEEFFIEDGVLNPGQVPKGAFRSELRSDPALRMLKKLVDLKYNANLPDLLERYTLTPASLPGRSALPFVRRKRQSHNLDALLEFHRAVIDNVPTVRLPRLRNLELEHVQAIRELPEWHAFKIAQRDLLKAGPQTLVNGFAVYRKLLYEFQSRMEEWSLTRGTEAEQVEKAFPTLKMLLNLVVQVGPVSLSAGLNHAGDGVEAKIVTKAINELVKSLPETFPQFCIKLTVSAWDAVRQRLDGDHSYQLELMRGGEIDRDEVLNMIATIEGSSQIPLSSTSGVSEQGKD